MRVLDTGRLLLRPLVGSDLNDLHRLYGDERTMQFISGGQRTRERTEQRLAAHLEQHQDSGFGLCAAIRKSDRQFIGRCGIEPRKETDGMAGELAWMFTPSCWGLGFGTEAAEGLLAFGLDELALHRVFATADHRNLASIAIMRKLGMKRVNADERGVEYELRR